VGAQQSVLAERALGGRARLWKERLQTVLCDTLGLNVTVRHYPTGCSKWNPIEHRLFSAISGHWAATRLLEPGYTFPAGADEVAPTRNVVAALASIH
jgi:hypothetical protein